MGVTDVQDSIAMLFLSLAPAEWTSDRFSLLWGGKMQCWVLSHKRLTLWEGWALLDEKLWRLFVQTLWFWVGLLRAQTTLSVFASPGLGCL